MTTVRVRNVEAKSRRGEFGKGSGDSRTRWQLWLFLNATLDPDFNVVNARQNYTVTVKNKRAFGGAIRFCSYGCGWERAGEAQGRPGIWLRDVVYLWKDKYTVEKYTTDPFVSASETLLDQFGPDHMGEKMVGASVTLQVPTGVYRVGGREGRYATQPGKSGRKRTPKERAALLEARKFADSRRRYLEEATRLVTAK